MVDLYFDEASLVRIEPKQGSQVLIFKNEEKDETISVPVSNEELLNIYHRAKIRCELLGLIPR